MPLVTSLSFHFKVLEKEDKPAEELHDSLDDAVNERADDDKDKVEIIKKKDEEPVAAEAASLSVRNVH